MVTRPCPAIKIYADDLYARQDFRQFLSGAHQNRVATWHGYDHGKRAGEYSDVFFHYDDGEFSDIFPEEVEEILIELLEAEGFRHGIVWLIPYNLEGE